MYTTTPLVPDLGRINPLSGFSRIWSVNSAARLLASVLKLAVGCAIVVGFVSGNLPQWLGGTSEDTAQFAQQLGGSLASLAFQMSLGLVALAGLDYGFQRWKFEQDIKMTRQEMLDELRDSEGDPQMKQRRREAHRKLIDARQLREAQTANVLLANSTNFLIAIQYDPAQQDAPIVVARGQGQFAAQLRHTAMAHGVPIIERPALASALFHAVQVGRPIPKEAFAEVAEVLATASQLADAN